MVHDDTSFLATYSRRRGNYKLEILASQFFCIGVDDLRMRVAKEFYLVYDLARF